MRYIVLIVTILVSSIFAKSLYLSNLPLPQTYIIKLDNKQCDKICLEDLLSNGEVFSFLSHYNPAQSDENLTNSYQMLRMSLNLQAQISANKISIALLFPKKIIGRYAISTTNSILAYLLNKNIDFQFETFDCQNELLPNIEKSVREIEEKGYRYVIAPFTLDGANTLSKVESKLIFYIPTVNKNDVNFSNGNFVFGGIDYKKQIEKLMPFTNDKIAIFLDDSTIGYKISSYIEDTDKDIVYKKVLPQNQTRFKQFLKYNRKLQNSSIFLNTPLVKSSLLASQFRFYKIEPYALFSTQVNYNPLLLSLTQYEDRKDMFIANSIKQSDFYLDTINEILFNDIEFDWINYSTSIGVDYIYSFYNTDTPRVFSENIINNQVDYDIDIVKPTLSGFEELQIFQ